MVFQVRNAEFGMRNGPGELRKRTKQFALDIIRFTQILGDRGPESVLGRQLLRAGTSVGANYRAACRAKSRADFIAKMGTVEEEADECGFWLDLLNESQLANGPQVKQLMKESSEITAMVVASIRSARTSKEKEYSALRTPHSALESAGNV